MFILEYSKDNVLSTDNEVWSYPTHDLAYMAMVRKVEEQAAHDDYDLEEGTPDKQGNMDLFGSWCGEGRTCIGFLNAFDAFLDDGDHRWVIHEVPGTLVQEHDHYPTPKTMRKEAIDTSIYLFEESDVAFFNEEYAYRNPIVADDDQTVFWTTIGVPDDEHGYVVTVMEVDGVWICEFTQGEHTGMYQAEGDTPQEAWENSKRLFCNGEE